MSLVFLHTKSNKYFHMLPKVTLILHVFVRKSSLNISKPQNS